MIYFAKNMNNYSQLKIVVTQNNYYKAWKQVDLNKIEVLLAKILPSIDKNSQYSLKIIFCYSFNFIIKVVRKKSFFM